MSLLAALLAQTGQLSEAIAVLERCVARFPMEAMAHHELAVACLQSGRLEESVRHFERALQLEPDHPKAVQGLSLSRKLLGRGVVVPAGIRSIDRTPGAVGPE